MQYAIHDPPFFGRLVLTGGEVPRTATVTATVVDNTALRKATVALGVDFAEVEGIAVRLGSDRHS